jgi:hypothetical protein
MTALAASGLTPAQLSYTAGARNHHSHIGIGGESPLQLGVLILREIGVDRAGE